MKIFKRTITLVLSLIVTSSVFMLPTTVSAAKADVQSAVIPLYEGEAFTYSYKYSEWHDFKTSISNNKKNYVKAELNFDAGDGEFEIYYNLILTGLKKTPKNTTPVVSVYYKNKSGKKIVVHKVKVKVTGTKPRIQKFKNVKLNVGTLKPAQTLKYNYMNVEERISDKSVVKSSYNSPYTTTNIYNGEYSDRGYIKALKPGTAKISYYTRDTGIKIGEYKVTVKDIKPTIKKKYKTITLKLFDNKKYNSVYDRKKFYTALVLNNYHTDAVYTTKNSDTNVLSAKTVKKGRVSPNTNELISAKSIGTAKVTIYEKLPGKKKTKVGTVNTIVKKGKMADVCASSERQEPLGVFFTYSVKLGKTFDAKKIVEYNALNYFKKGEYTIEFSSTDTNILTVDENGIVTAKALNPDNKAKIKAKVTFADGSVRTVTDSLEVVK